VGPGQPGIALGGLFYLLLALIGPVVELVRALRGRSTAASRRLVARHFALAVAMIVALDLAYRGVELLSGRAAGGEMVALPALPILIGMAVLGCVLAATKLADLALRRRATRRRRRLRAAFAQNRP
jgi:hypothetical protein